MSTKDGLLFGLILATRDLMGLTRAQIHADGLWRRFLAFISGPGREFSAFGFSRNATKFEKMIASPRDIMKKFKTFGSKTSHGQIEGDKYKKNYKFVLSAMNVGFDITSY